MERLTKKDGNEYCRKYLRIKNQQLIDKLADYENAEENGLLLRLPCKVGDSLWTFVGEKMFEVEVLKIKYECEAENHSVFIRSQITITCKDIIATTIDFSDIGKTVFLTREDAELSLMMMKEDK